jgi:hypothetical protein
LWPNPDARLFGGAQRLATNYFRRSAKQRSKSPIMLAKRNRNDQKCPCIETTLRRRENRKMRDQDQGIRTPPRVRLIFLGEYQKFWYDTLMPEKRDAATLTRFAHNPRRELKHGQIFLYGFAVTH